MVDSLNTLYTQLSSNVKTDTQLIDVKDHLKKYNATDWKNYVKFNDNMYNRELVSHNDLFDILVISWKKGQKSKIHDHPNQGCLMKILTGKLLENTYINTTPMTHISATLLLENDIGYKEGNQILHDISAIEDSVSLHIYSPSGYQPHYY